MQRADAFDLTTLKLKSGEGRRLELDVATEPLRFGGQEYTINDGEVGVRLDISRTTSGYAMKIGLEAEPAGPCARCLEPARRTVAVESREVEDLATGDEELTSPYVDDEELDLGSWVRDAIALALPEKFLCRDDCKGLCPECGESLNDADPEDHRHGGGGDPRFAKLRELLE